LLFGATQRHGSTPGLTSTTKDQAPGRGQPRMTFPIRIMEINPKIWGEACRGTFLPDLRIRIRALPV
jgi:hypothetical protein